MNPWFRHADAAYALDALHDAGRDVALSQLAVPGIEVVEGKIGDVTVVVDRSDDFGVVGDLHSE
jgi:hypothetical protein